MGVSPFFSGLRIYLQPKFLGIFFLGIASGLPLMLTGATLSYWLAKEGVDKATIGLFGLIAIPYSFKFLWAPIIDGVALPYLTWRFGRRRGWLILLQALLMLCLALLGGSHPAESPWIAAFFALLVAFFSASQDIVIDAYRVEILEKQEYASGAAVIVMGYRIGMLISGAGALYMVAGGLDWSTIYMVMAVILIVGTASALFLGEPQVPSREAPHSLRDFFRDSVIAPFADFMARQGWIIMLLFIIFYKFGEAFAASMSTPFLVDMGFTAGEIATITKLFGTVAILTGGIIGGMIAAKTDMIRSLWICGIIQMLSIFAYLFQSLVGHDTAILTITVSIEYLAAGMGTSVFVAYISSLCNLRFTATQFALLSALASFGRTFLSSPSGWVVEQLGWQGFFLLSIALAIPGLLLLARLPKSH